jgi:bilirubin oxidase
MKAILFSAALCVGATICAQTPLLIPDTLTGSVINLQMHKDSVQFFPGKKSQTYAFNANSYLGPTLLLQKGTIVNINVTNQIGDTTTVHWHGLHVPSKWDGGPHTTILPGTNWNPQFTVMDHAATYWYHPHLHMKTAEQAIKGAAGFIIVRDPVESALNLPRKYGKDDFPLVIQCVQFDNQNQAMPEGMQDSTLIVNGLRSNYGYTVNANFPAQVVRLRLLNGSGERAFNFGFSGNLNFHLIASDGGLLNAPYLTNRIRLAPGERAEILLDLNGKSGQTIHLMSYASELAMGIQGGPTMPMPPWAPPMDSPLNGANFNIMQITVTPQTTSPVTTIPASLVTNTPFTVSQANITRTIRFTADSAMVMDGPFYFNDSIYKMERIDYDIPLNNVEIWKLVNETMVAHPFHLHDQQFFVLDRNGSAPGPEESGRKDVVLIPSGDSLMFITKFEDFADTMIPYMFHCHILMHEDDGMMGQFIVRNTSVGIQTQTMEADLIKIYPNPAADAVDIKFIDPGTITQIRAFDCSGRLIYSGATSELKTRIDVREWRSGIYFFEMSCQDRKLTKKILVQHNK